MNTRTNLRHNNSEKKLIINNVNYIDVDKYRDEVIKLKQELNKRNKEYQDLKVECLKLGKENKSNMKLMELVLYESRLNAKDNQNLNISEIINMNDNNKNNFDDNPNKKVNNMVLKEDKNIIGKNLCKQTIKKIKEKYLYSKMREEINHLKEEISEKDTLMVHLKNSSKIIRLRELDNKYADTYHELVELKDKYKKVENIQQDYYLAQNKMLSLFQQLDYYKKQGKIQKEQLEKISLQNKNYAKMIENNENQKSIEENKKKYFKSENEKLKKQIKELSEMNYNLIGEAQKLRGKNDKNLNKIKNENKKLKEENEKFKKEIERLKKIIADKDKQKEKPKDDFFMTSAKIVVENNNDNNNKIEEKKENINEISVLEKQNEEKKLDTKDIEIMDLKSEIEKKEEKK
jgi:trichohyalin